MYKQLSNRNHRSKRIKVKHVLQIGLLLLICFWLLYQVKHSHDRKKELDEQDAKMSLNTERKDEVVKLGRKDLHPQMKETTNKGEMHDEEIEEEDENTGGGEENNKHEEEEQADNKIEEKDDDEGRGAVDEDVDDHDEEKSDTENDREEDFVDEDKERENGEEQESEERDSEDNNGQTESDSGLHDQDHEGGARNTHEAREENYKADDASSAVTHDTQMTTTYNETVILEKSNEKAGMDIVEHQNMSNNTDENKDSQNTFVKGEEVETTNNSGYLDVTTNEVSKINSSNSNETKGSDNGFQVTDNSKEVTRETRLLSLLNENGTTSESTRVQNIVVGDESAREDSNLQITDRNNSTLGNENYQYDFNSTTNTKTEDSDSTHGELPKLSVDSESSTAEMKSNVSAEAENGSGSSMMESIDSTQAVKVFGSESSTAKMKSNVSAEAENGSGSSMMESNDATQDVKDDETDGMNEGLDESNSEISDEVPRDPIDSSDSSISLEEKDVRNDLETLPEMQTEGSNSEDAVAE